MNGNVTDLGLMLEVQGRRVLVGARVLTLVHVVDIGHRELRLVNREAKDGKPDLLLTQAMWKATEPAKSNKLNYQYELKA